MASSFSYHYSACDEGHFLFAWNAPKIYCSSQIHPIEPHMIMVTNLCLESIPSVLQVIHCIPHLYATARKQSICVVIPNGSTNCNCEAMWSHVLYSWKMFFTNTSAYFCVYICWASCLYLLALLTAPAVSFFHCLRVRYSGCWTTTRQLKEWVCHVPPSTATICCTARSRS